MWFKMQLRGTRGRDFPQTGRNKPTSNFTYWPNDPILNNGKNKRETVDKL